MFNQFIAPAFLFTTIAVVALLLSFHAAQSWANTHTQPPHKHPEKPVS